MATTTNYGWTTPDDTALVKDGAAAIRTLGSSVDTTTKALNPSTTLGDIEYRSSTANTNTRLGIGSTGNVLTVAGGVPSWAAPAAGGKTMTLITSGTLSGATVNLTGLSSYETLYFSMPAWTTSGATQSSMIINSDSSGIYQGTGYDFANNIAADPTTLITTTDTKMRFAFTANQQAANAGAAFWTFENCSATGFTKVSIDATYTDNGATAVYTSRSNWVYKSAAAVSNITLQCNGATTYTAGNYYLWGAK